MRKSRCVWVRRKRSGPDSVSRAADAETIFHYSFRHSLRGGEEAVLEEDDDQPRELSPDEHERRLLPPGDHARAVVQESEDERDHAEERAVVTRHDSVVEEEAAGERPQDVGAEPLGDDRYQHGRARAGLAEEARNADGEGAAEEEQQERDDGEAGHALFRYSGRQRSRRGSTCLIPSAMTMPIRPRVSSATIMSAAFSVPSDWMIR